MSRIDYSRAAYPVGDDFTTSHDDYWQRLAAAGTWLTGAQRVAVAKEVRQSQVCGFCGQRKEALSPYNIEGMHQVVTDLSEVMIEVIHRITTDPQRLTKTWFDSVIESGLSEEEYVEILGVLGGVFQIDEFCRGIGIAPHALPEPQAGEPSGYRPAKAGPDGAWVSMLPKDGNVDAEADLWSGQAGNVVRALSLVPNETRSFQNLVKPHYLDPSTIWNVTRSPHGALSRIQIEVVAARVSAFNNCFY